MPMKTKKAIADTFLALINEKNIDKITVKDVSEACGISRQSFYYHFQDTLDLLEWIVEQSIQEAVARTLEEDDPIASIERFVCISVENHRPMQKLLSSQQHEQFLKIFIQGLETYLSELLRHKRPNLAASRSDVDVACQFFACGIAGLLLMHSGDKNLDTHRMAEQIFRLISRQADV